MNQFTNIWNTKEITQQKILEVFNKFGYLSITLLLKEAKISRHIIDKYWENFENCSKELDIPYKSQKTKIVKCLRCQNELEISKYALDNFEERYCDSCKMILNNQKFDGKKKDYDYCECPECGFRGLSLVYHWDICNIPRNKWQHCKISFVEAERKHGKIRRIRILKDERIKESRRQNGWFKDREKTIEKMSESGGKHIKGKTKENCEWIKRLSEKKKEMYKLGQLIAIFKGKSAKEGYLPLIKIGMSIKETRKLKFWSSNKLNLTKEQLEEFLIDGKVKISTLIHELNISYPTARKYLQQFNITYNKVDHLTQNWVMWKISRILNEPFIPEYIFKDIYTVDKIGRKHHSRYDGYFPNINLVIEVHGFQHYDFPNQFHKTKEQWQQYVEHDKFKKQKILDKELKFIEIDCRQKITDDILQQELAKVNLLQISA